MAEFPVPPQKDDADETASAEWLVEPSGASPPTAPNGVTPTTAGEAYGLEGGDAPDSDAEPAAPVSPIPLVPAPRREPKPAARLRPNATWNEDSGDFETLADPVEAPDRPSPRRPRAETSRDPASTSASAPRVDPVWSRWGEWGPDLIRLAIIAVAGLFLLFLAVAAGFGSLAFLLFVAMVAAVAVFSYPIVITLERPVRVTPEQAVKDYFAALSHHLPHYRRMWLLLSSAGRNTARFSSFPAFQAYWEEQIAALRGPEPSRFSPFIFSVEDFRSPKSSGQTETEATFTLRVANRSEPGAAPVASYAMTVGLVKGPDRMWYLNQATLPEAKV